MTKKTKDLISKQIKIVSATVIILVMPLITKVYHDDVAIARAASLRSIENSERLAGISVTLKHLNTELEEIKRIQRDQRDRSYINQLLIKQVLVELKRRN